MEKVFSIGDKLEITPAKSAFSYESSAKKYASQILDYDEIKTARIAAPMFDGRLVPLRVNDDVDLCFFTKAGLYQCRGRIKKRYEDNRVPVMDVLFVSELQKFQRRRFYRLECTFEFNYRRLSKEEVEIREKLDLARKLGTEAEVKALEDDLMEIYENWQTGTITNLSAGGLRFHLAESLLKNEPIEVVVPLSMTSGVVMMRMMAHVIDCARSEDVRAKMSDARLEFDSITNQERERIVKYVFEEQRRRMSGGER